MTEQWFFGLIVGLAIPILSRHILRLWGWNAIGRRRRDHRAIEGWFERSNWE